MCFLGIGRVMICSFSKFYLIYRDNEAELQDGYFSYKPGGDELSFVGVDRVDSRLAVQDDADDNTIYSKLPTMPFSSLPYQSMP